MLGPGLRYRGFFLAVLVFLIFVLFFLGPLPTSIDNYRDGLVHRNSDKGSAHQSHENGPRNAFATFLACNNDECKEEDWNRDYYFIATRILAYQLLHAPETRSKTSIPFIVMVTDEVSPAKRQRLIDDGAIVYVAEYIREDWVVPDASTWRDMLTKLRLWELTDYDRVVFLDGDTVLTRPLDGIFDDPAALPVNTKNLTAEIKSDEGALPSSYVFAGVPEMNHEHGYPPTEANHDFPNWNYFNAGFFVFQPSRAVFEHYLSIIKIPNRFERGMAEQNLLNYAHRQEGNMPWQRLANTWNIHYPTLEDLKGGVASLHEKWWSPEHVDLLPYMLSWRWRMDGFFEGRDLLFRQDR